MTRSTGSRPSAAELVEITQIADRFTVMLWRCNSFRTPFMVSWRAPHNDNFDVTVNGRKYFFNETRARDSYRERVRRTAVIVATIALD